MIDAEIVIAGAGPCGIGAAWTLQHDFPHRRFVLVEASSSVGGCAASLVTPEGFTFDYGGHVLFPHQSYHGFAALLKTWIEQWTASCPIRGVYMNGRFIPAPIQRNVHALPMPIAALIVSDLVCDRVARRIRSLRRSVFRTDEMSLETYLHEAFGRQLTKRIMAPLNRKMWAAQPRELSSVWVHQRSGSSLSNVAQVSLRRLLKHAVQRTADPGWDATTTVEYPARGGTGAIWIAAASKLRSERLIFRKRISSIITREQRVILDDGSSRRYSHLISTMPLDVLLRSCVDRPDFESLAKRLRHSRAFLFGYGIAGEIPRSFAAVHSFHCPEPALPFWRVTIPSNFSNGNVPAGGPAYSILCEVSCRVSHAVTIDNVLRKAVREGLAQIGLLPLSRTIVSTFEEALDHGYPLPFLGRDAVLNTIHRELEPLNILSRGRFGGWRYEVSNQDHSFAQGMEAARRIMIGVPETTYAKIAGVG